MTTLLTHGRVQLALHTLREADGPKLLLLHGLGEHAPQALLPQHAEWPGSVHALDFTGHGKSTVPRGGGYTCELLMADADAALGHLGGATVCGRGVGAYVALLLAGGRPGLTQGAILCDGPGLAGGGPRPTSPILFRPDPQAEAPPDPFALVELARDIRPPDYASAFARQATQFSERERPISVCAVERTEWLEAVLVEPGVEESPLADALRYYAAR